MRNFNLDHLQTLIAIADLGNFAAAAQALHQAPPPISRPIKGLAYPLQAALVVRGRRQAELTPAGEVLVQEGRQLLLACDDLMERVRRRDAERFDLELAGGLFAGMDTLIRHTGPLLPVLLLSRASQKR